MTHVYDVSPLFQERFEWVRAQFFSRNADLWPCFRDPGFQRIINFRKQCLHPDEKLDAYPGGPGLHDELQGPAQVPESSRPPGEDELLSFVGALSKDWENPASVENVVSMPCDPAIYGAMTGTLANPNLIYHEYAGMADALEKHVIRQIAQLAGYDPGDATGIFTQGGTFCNLYGYLTGIRKSLPGARLHGMGYTQDYRILNSQGGHYSNITNLSLLGVDVAARTIRIKMNARNDMDLEDLEHQLHSCFSLHCAVPSIMLTMGTTDTFAMDLVQPVCKIRDRLCEHYEIGVKPHIHVDAAIGWALIFFLNYDFEKNPLQINEITLQGLQRNVARVSQLKHADSFTVDFHKWGYVPYTSSLVMFKHRSDLETLENDPDNFSYFERDIQGQTHLQSTIECSRGAPGLFGAYAALKYMGIEGYQTILAHCLQNANYFRYRLNELGHIKVLVPENQGPSVGFRMYNPDTVTDPDQEFDFEYRIQDSERYLARLKRNNEWHRRVFLDRGKTALFTNWVQFIAHTDYDEKERYHKLPGEKAVFMNPSTTQRDIDAFIAHILPAGYGC